MATKSFLAFGCPHVPYHSKTAHEWLIGQVAERQPDHVICLGDLFEADAASVHSSDYAEHDLLDEFKAGADYLEALRSVSPNSRTHWLLGNHDSNIIRRDARRIPKKLRSMCDWNKHFEEFKSWKQSPYIKSRKGCIVLGQCIFTHGFDVGVNSDELEALQFANYVGQAFCLVTRAHTHHPRDVDQCHRTRRVPLPFYAANAGTLCDIPRMEYAHRMDTSQWGSAVVVGEYQELKSPRMSRTWEARTIIHRMGMEL